MLGIHWAREHAASRTRPGSNPLMTYHGGKIMKTATTQAIFWGPSWNNAGFADKINGIDLFYGGHGGSNYAKTSDEYTGSNGQVTATTMHIGHLVDLSTAAGGNRTSVILAEVCKMVSSPDSQGNGYYAVYSDVKRGGAQYCAYHSAGTCNGVPVQFAFFFNLDGDSGCDPQDTSGLHSQGLAALANVSAHELAEARTDPSSPGAWYDGQGEENGDKCAVDVRRAARRLQQRHAVEAAGRVVERRVQRQDRVSELGGPTRMPVRQVTPAHRARASFCISARARSLAGVTALAVGAALASSAAAQPRLPPGVDGSAPAPATATRAVAHYLDLERAHRRRAARAPARSRRTDARAGIRGPLGRSARCDRRSGVARRAAACAGRRRRSCATSRCASSAISPSSASSSTQLRCGERERRRCTSSTSGASRTRASWRATKRSPRIRCAPRRGRAAASSQTYGAASRSVANARCTAGRASMRSSQGLTCGSMRAGRAKPRVQRQSTKAYASATL
jgi:hypothetical protein